MGAENRDTSPDQPSVDQIIEQEGFFDFPISVPKGGHERLTPAELEAERERLSQGARRAAELRQGTPSQPKDHIVVEESSQARRDQTSAALYDTESVVDAQLALERSQQLANDEASRVRRAERDAEAARQTKVNARSKPNLGFETAVQRQLREASERQATRRAAAEADPSIRESDLALGAEAAARERMLQDRIQTPTDARAVADRLAREARERIDRTND
jgi:hypothetical protein